MFWPLWEWDCVAGIWRIPLSPGYQVSWVCRASGSAFALIAVTTGGGAFGNWLTWERKCRVGSGYVIGHLLLVHKVRHSFMITTVQKYIIHWSWIVWNDKNIMCMAWSYTSTLLTLAVRIPLDVVSSRPVHKWKRSVLHCINCYICIQRPVCAILRVLPSLIGI